jgi:L-amino acid N-acyltransferase YncA
MDFAIDAMCRADWPEVRAIYLEGIATGNATFETVAPTWEAWDAAHRPERLVARAEKRVLGWAALSPYSARRVYGGVAEVGIYIAVAARGRKIGRALLEALIEAAERSGVWTLQAGVFPENTASIELHRRCGFREVGRRERIGRLGEVWRDVILLERRSRTVGTAPATGERAKS